MSAFGHPVARGRYLEAPRWHDGALWVVDSLARTLLRVSDGGRCETVCALSDTPAGLGFMPTGEILVTGMWTRILFDCADGNPQFHADLSTIVTGTIDDMIVDGVGRCFVGDLGFDLRAGVPPGAKGGLALAPPDSHARMVADGLRFPNGIAVAPDNRTLVVAESDGDCLSEFEILADGVLVFRRRYGLIGEPDGLCLDSEGGVWVAAFKEDAVVRLDRDGRITERIAVPGRGIACVLGGGDRRDRYCISAETTHEDLRRGRSTSRVDAIRVSIPGAGNP